MHLEDRWSHTSGGFEPQALLIGGHRGEGCDQARLSVVNDIVDNGGWGGYTR
jgi:hypothetical protein